jgi:KaiC/GvpD/RAD55 family RecA-like ATPase
MMDEPSNLTWSWKIQYLLTINVDPTGIDSQPSISPSGPWYDNGTVVSCTSQDIGGYSFDHWNVDGTNREGDGGTINITMSGPHEATVYYTIAVTWWEQTDTLLILGFLGVAVTAVTVGTLWIRRYRKKEAEEGLEPEIEVPEFLPGRIPVGHADLDKLLLGGIPQNYAVILTSPSCDERDLLVKKFLATGANEGEVTFCVTTHPGRLKTLAEESQSNFYLFICNPRADMIIKDLPNVFKLKGVENLTKISIEITKAYNQAGVDSTAGSKRACIEVVSDVLLHHGPIKIRRWLTDLVTELKSKGFTTLAVIDPQMHSPKEVHAILDLFEGEINIYEKETGARFLIIKKMYNKNYIECELRLKKEGPKDREK